MSAVDGLVGAGGDEKGRSEPPEGFYKGCLVGLGISAAFWLLLGLVVVLAWRAWG